MPCYNEEKRFPYNAFLSFAKNNQDVLLCLVNDGSKDNTISVLRAIQLESPNNISVYSLEKNSGKSEAVRQGTLYVHKNFHVPLIGFLDADLATIPEEWLEMAKYKEKYPQFGAIVGSRIQRLGADINRNDNRSLLSGIIKKFIRIILKTTFQDTQCGAKIMTKEIIENTFQTKFLTKWLFDVEISHRMILQFGREKMGSICKEVPLKSWIDYDESKVKMTYFFKLWLDLYQIGKTYKLRKE